ncbi:aspartyl-tRNA amidotransferase subunit B [Paenibacillus sp. J31TS4]|uniref:GatB/YqeY domain-containing protein n=1 Tax=Paenibacillus sp. J31TS4 TaxID=2807195 RepID=UPI001B04D95D|nr:GatB/YqeY domain-containing protein [Paenibacillus sp. J31TS4]GIP39606.1 aspartyl-tRNA amidotransferase subunit B [Paenibacillus sp. J31TS4]
MSLSDRLNEDMKQAMKSQNKFRLSVIRMIRSAIKNIEIDQRTTLDDDQVLDILNREIKQRRDSLQEFDKAGRDDLAEQAKAEIEIIAEFLPQQLTEEEVRVLVQQTIQETGASSKAEMGKVMSALMPKVKGRADGKLVNQLVQQALSTTQ